MTDIVDRLRGQIDKRGDNECWPWTGGVFTRSGYGRVTMPRLDGKQRGTTAHRALWSAMYGEPHPTLEVCHTCDNRLCCNPSHLFLATPKVNAMDKANKGRSARIIGARNGAAKLTPESVAEIRQSPSRHSDIARKYGVSESNVRMIRTRRTWDHV